MSIHMCLRMLCVRTRLDTCVHTCLHAHVLAQRHNQRQVLSANSQNSAVSISALHRHRRRHALCTGMGVLALGTIASARAFQRSPAQAKRLGCAHVCTRAYFLWAHTGPQPAPSLLGEFANLVLRQAPEVQRRRAAARRDSRCAPKIGTRVDMLHRHAPGHVLRRTAGKFSARGRSFF